MIELLCSLRTERHPVIPVVFKTPLMCFGTILFVHLAFMLSIDPVFGPSSLGRPRRLYWTILLVVRIVQGLQGFIV